MPSSSGLSLLIIAFWIGEFTLRVTADWLNLKHLSSKQPKGFESFCDPEHCRVSQAYLIAHTHFGWLTGAVDLSVLFIFWFAGGFALLDRWVQSVGVGPVASGLLYIGCLFGLKSLLAMPMDAYATFGIEARFGFNRSSKATFATDRIKAMALAVVFGSPILAAVLALLEYAGADAWWACWLATTLFLLGVQFLAPTWILPLFNRFTPLEPGPLRDAVLAYVEKVGFPMENVYAMDGSKRSTKSNAFFTGFRNQRRIVFFDTLLQSHTVEQLVAILAHEMGHFKKKHVLAGFAMGVIQTGIMFYLLSWFLDNPALSAAFFMDHVSVYATLVFFTLLYAPLDFGLSLIFRTVSRHSELSADRYAVETTGNAQALVEALKKLAVDNRSNLCPHPLHVFVNASHPPVRQRIEAIEAQTDRGPAT
jgi:STE24 endopeptidase